MRLDQYFQSFEIQKKTISVNNEKVLECPLHKNGFLPLVRLQTGAHLFVSKVRKLNSENYILECKANIPDPDFITRQVTYTENIYFLSE